MTAWTIIRILLTDEAERLGITDRLAVSSDEYHEFNERCKRICDGRSLGEISGLGGLSVMEAAAIVSNADRADLSLAEAAECLAKFAKIGGEIAPEEPRFDMALAQRLADFLNSLLELDRQAVACLIGNRVPCRAELAEHEAVQVRFRNGGYDVSMLGILAGFCGIMPDGMSPLQAVWAAEPGKFPDLKRFQVAKIGDHAAQDPVSPRCNELDWIESSDDHDNTSWEALSIFSSESGPDAIPDIFWRIKQRLACDAIEYYAAHSAELCGANGPWDSLEEAKADCQRAHDESIANEMSRIEQESDG